MSSSVSATKQIIISASPNHITLARAEVERIDHNTDIKDWLDEGVAHIGLSKNWATLALTFRDRPPIFTRHMFPVQRTMQIEQAPDDLEIMAHLIEDLFIQIDPAIPFSVQTRILGKGSWPYGRFEVNKKLSGLIEKATGAKLDVPNPEQVLSVVITKDRAYIGLSLVRDNISSWAGGERRFKREQGQISRAEFKLIEAFETFGLTLPENGLALDMGAAPGGWTRILMENGLNVVAVDPANMDPWLLSSEQVSHAQVSIQKYLQDAPQFDLIVNDMRMDVRKSARIMLTAAEHLKPGGFALMTLKLPEWRVEQALKSGFNLLKKSYRIAGAKQLFHNRSEVTVWLEKLS
jgi:23S rRNA (cytidine2498-2'-O)-methyltransferase